MRELDDAIALGLGARARGEPLAWLQAPAGNGRAGDRDPVGALPPRAVRARARGRVRVRGGAVSRRAPAVGCRARRRRPRRPRRRRDGACRGRRPRPAAARCERRPGAPRLDARARRRRQQRVRARRGGSPGVAGRRAARARARAAPGRHGCSSPCRSASRATTAGSGSTTSPAGRASSRSAGLFVEEQEAYELTAEGWRAAPGFRARRRRLRRPRAGGVGRPLHEPSRSDGSAGWRRPTASARTVKRRLRPLRHRTSALDCGRGLRPHRRAAGDPGARAGVRRGRRSRRTRRTGTASTGSRARSSRSSASSA